MRASVELRHGTKDGMERNHDRSFTEIRELVRDLAVCSTIQEGRYSSLTRSHIQHLRALNLGPWFYNALSGPSRASLRGDLEMELQEDYRQLSVKAALHEMALRELLCEFQEAGIEVTALKGTYLGLHVYCNTAHRPMADLDLMVRSNRREQAHDILTTLGYQKYYDPEGTHEDLVLHAQCYIRDRHAKQYVDLHWDLYFFDYYRCPDSILWDNTEESQLYGFKIRFFNPEMNFIHIALHALNHGSGLRDCVDLLLLSRRLEPDWDRIVALAQAMGVMRPLYWAIRHLDEQWGFGTPARVRRRLATYKPERMEDRVIRGRFRLLWRWVSRLLVIPDWPSRLRYLSEKVFPRRCYRQFVSGSPNLLRYMSHRLYSLVRSFRKT